MRPVTYEHARDVAGAAASLQVPGGRLLGGGTNLVDLMRKGVEQPSRLVDVTGLSDAIEGAGDGSLVIGAATRNTAVAAHPLVREQYPMLARAILAGASAQVRNMATVGGNLMQRTRCLYFQDAAGARCNKRAPLSGCAAVGGLTRYHAILGTSASCDASHPSDLCVALAALDAVVHVTGPAGARAIPLVDFHRLPGDRPDLETALGPDEVIVSVALPAASAGIPSTYRKVRDRASYAFALVSMAAAIEMDGERIGRVRIALGGVAPKPWRAFRAEELLTGVRATPERFAEALGSEMANAVTQADNAFKADLAIRTGTAVLTQLVGSVA